MHIHWQWTGKDLKHGELQGELPFCISTVMETNNKQKHKIQYREQKTPFTLDPTHYFLGNMKWSQLLHSLPPEFHVKSFKSTKWGPSIIQLWLWRNGRVEQVKGRRAKGSGYTVSKNWRITTPVLASRLTNLLVFTHHAKSGLLISIQ